MWLIGFLATFIGIGIGGVLAYFVNGFSRSIGTIYAICTGLILGLISFEIAPEAIQMGGWVIFLCGFIAGIILFKLMHVGIHRKSTMTIKSQKTGLFLALIFAVHNFPMGVVLGAGDHADMNMPLLEAIILHNIPEGMILFTPLFIIGFKFFKMPILSVIVSLPVALGAFLGSLLDMQNDLLWAFLMSLIVGTIYMVTIKEILPESTRHSSNRYSVFVVLISFCLLGTFIIFF